MYLATGLTYALEAISGVSLVVALKDDDGLKPPIRCQNTIAGVGFRHLLALSLPFNH